MNEFNSKLSKIIDRYNYLQDTLSTMKVSNEYVQLTKELSELHIIVEKINFFHSTQRQLEENKELLDDPEFHEIASEEILDLENKLPGLISDIKIALLPKDVADEKNAIIEVRAGTGGEEAALFASSLFSMYQKYAESQRWKFEILEINDTGIGGYREASALISGSGVFAKLKYESGTHRVQRVPETESSGRVHTSAATVAVLPEAEDVDIAIEDKDIKIETCRASGAGGQHVNTTDSAVKLTHIPTGIVVSLQDERSQHKNKAKAMKILRSKIYELEREKIQKERSSARKAQVGSGDRSERIRTYNFPQSRVTDHRINLTLYKIHDIVIEGKLDFILDRLIQEDQLSQLAHM